MSGAQSISTRRAYGVQRVCRVWARPRSSVYARRQAPRDCARGHRRGPVGAAPDDVLVGHIRRVLEASPFHGEGYRKVWAKLRVEGIRTSDLPAFFGPVITGEQRQLKFVVRLRVLPGQREPALPTSALRHPSQP